MKTARALPIGAALASLSASPALSALKSLFVQVVSVPAGAEAYKTRTWFKKVCDEHKQSGSPTYIYDLVLSEIADDNGKLDTERLDIVEDYFGCFDNVFVGTANLSHPDPYVSGMKDSDFRWANITYAAYLLELSNRLTAIRPGSILWSPAFWTKYASVSNKSALAAAVKRRQCRRRARSAGW